ncbi:MAG TPA: hypothetical protein VE093_21755 [Polyangiaceae bacterium]|jgi:hypothetical protein|nr:hypothetical protein [Polyangiaceae bacterium]
MKRSIPLLLSLSALFVAGSAGAEEGRFDAQVFRPAAAPRDLVMVQKSEVIGHFSPTVGFYYDVALNPLELAVNDTGRTMAAVAARLQLTALAGIGFFNLFEVTAAMPFIAWQPSDNLRAVGTEGKIQTPAFGDLRLSTKISIPYLNRKEEVKEGLGRRSILCVSQEMLGSGELLVSENMLGEEATQKWKKSLRTRS